MGVSVRHNSRLAALVATVAAVMTVAWFSRALQTGSALDWVWCVAHGRCRAAPAARHPRWPGTADGGRRSRRTSPPRPDLERSALAGHRQRGGHLTKLVAARRPDRRTPARGQRRGVPARPGCVRGVRERGPGRRWGGCGGELHGGVRRPARAHHPGRVRRPQRRPGLRSGRARERPGSRAGADQDRAGEGAEGEGREGSEGRKPEKAARRRRQRRHRSRRRRRRRRQRRHRSPRSCQRRRPPRPRSRRSSPAC